MNKKNILIVTDALFVGGLESVICSIALKLDRSKFNVSVCHLKPEFGVIGEQLKEQGIEVLSVQRKSGLKKYFSFLGLLKLVKEKRIDLIHSHTTYSLIDCSLCKILYKKVKHVHTFHFGNYPHYDKKYMFLERIFTRFPDKLIPVGFRQKSQIENIYPVKEEKIQVIWNGVDQHSDIDQELLDQYKESDRVILGTICMFTKQKALDFLFEVIDKLRKRNDNFLVIIAGGGPIFDEIKQLRDKKGLQDIINLLGIYPNAASRALPIFDIFVQSSLWEAMSIAIIEAMACKKPIVATDVGDNKKVVEEGGFIVEPLNVDDMVNKLEKLINDEELRNKLGKIGHERYKKYCSTETMAHNYGNLYLNLLK